MFAGQTSGTGSSQKDPVLQMMQQLMGRRTWLDGWRSSRDGWFGGSRRSGDGYGYTSSGDSTNAAEGAVVRDVVEGITCAE